MAISLALLLLAGLFAAHLFQKIELPGLLGMVAVGTLFGPYFLNILHPTLLEISPDLRMTALVILLLRAGLNLQRTALLRVGWVALLMAVVPVTLEGAVITGLVSLLFSTPILESLLFASVVVAISPAVVVPFMLHFIQKRWGTAQGIPTLILSAAALEVVFVIVLFTLLLGIQGDRGLLSLWQLLKIPESLCLGVLAGLLFGWITQVLFKRCALPLTQMTLIVIALSMLLTGLESLLKPHLTLSALLGVMTIGFVLLEKDPETAQALSQQLTKIWTFAEILLFVLVGAQVNIPVVWEAGLTGVLLIILGLVARSVAVWFCVGTLSFNHQERLLCVVAFLPKATVPAALGAIPLQHGIPSGDIILAVAVLTILISAPLGSIGLRHAGPRCLQQEK